MAVLKYKSNGKIKTLGITEYVTTSVTSVNGKTGAVTGMYDKDNPPPYPVTSVNGKTGAVTDLYGKNNPPPYPVTSVNGKTGDVETYNIVTLDPNTEKQTFTITKGFNIVKNIVLVRSNSFLGAGMTATRTAAVSKANAINILGISLQNNAYDTQCTAYTNGNTVGFVVTNHSGEGETTSGIYCTAFIYTDENSLTINFGV